MVLIIVWNSIGGISVMNNSKVVSTKLQLLRSFDFNTFETSVMSNILSLSSSGLYIFSVRIFAYELK